MGGNALKKFNVNRIPNIETRNALAYDIMGIFKNKLFSDKDIYLWEICEPIYKTDFGDIDFVVCCPKELFLEKISNLKYVRNDNVYSVLFWDEYQVDLIWFDDQKKAKLWYNFVRFGDFGMLLGRIARIFGLKYGVNGLTFPIRDLNTNHVTSEIEVSTDHNEIFKFFGFNYDFALKNYLKFTKEEIIKWWFSSPFIDQEFLKRYSESTKHRKRDKNRGFYAEAMEWFEENKKRFPQKITVSFESELSHIESLALQFKNPKLIKDYQEFRAFGIIEKVARDKFNFLSGVELFEKEIGKENAENLMKKFFAAFSDKKERTFFIYDNSLDEIEKSIRRFL